MSDAVSKATADHELRMRQLQDQVDGMERQTQEIMEKNREEESRLRREKTKAENTLNAKIALYDEDMKSRQKTLEDLRFSFKQEEQEYSKLKEYFDKVDANINRSDEEERIIAAIARREEFGRRVLHDAAATIQKIARGRIARAFCTKLKSKKGGKKGKGKKGKKGK